MDMTYVFIGVFISCIIIYIIGLNRTIKLQNSVIKEHRLVIDKYKLEYLNLKNEMDRLFNHFNIPINDGKPKEEVYDLDDILSEISEKGIDNISSDKLNFLKNYKR